MRIYIQILTIIYIVCILQHYTFVTKLNSDYSPNMLFILCNSRPLKI